MGLLRIQPDGLRSNPDVPAFQPRAFDIDLQVGSTLVAAGRPSGQEPDPVAPITTA